MNFQNLPIGTVIIHDTPTLFAPTWCEPYTRSILIKTSKNYTTEIWNDRSDDECAACLKITCTCGSKLHGSPTDHYKQKIGKRWRMDKNLNSDYTLAPPSITKLLQEAQK